MLSRRTFVFGAGLTMLGAQLPRRARAVPCPPPSLSVAGGTSAVSICPTPPANSPLTPTHYVDAAASGAGVGTASNPFTLTQACALAQPGWRVRINAGTYVGANTGARFDACWRVENNGTPENRIIFFAENYAALSSSGRTILQNDAPRQGDGCPVFGLYGDYTELIGVYVNEDQAATTPDTGPIVVVGNYTAVRYCRISRGAHAWPDDRIDNNHAAIRIEGNHHVVVADNWIENYRGDAPDRGESGVIAFSTPESYTHSLLFENNFFQNNIFAVYIKGAGTRRPMDGNIVARRNISTADFDSASFINYSDTRAIQGRNQVYQNIQVGGCQLVRPSVQGGGIQTQELDVVNNTCINLVTHENSGVLYDWYQGDQPPSWRVHNNICVGGARMFAFPYSPDTALLSCDSNCGFEMPLWGTIEAHGDLSLAAAQALGYDLESFVADPLFVSTAVGNSGLGKLGTGSPCLNAGIDILGLRGGATNAPTHMGAYVLAEQTDVLGIRPLT